MTHDETDISIPNLGVPLAFSRHYDSFNTAGPGQAAWSDRGMGEGWSFTYSDYIDSASNFPSYDPTTDPAGTVIWFNDQGIQLKFKPQVGGGYSNPDGMFGTFSYDGSTTGYTWTDKDGNKVVFHQSGGGAKWLVTQESDRYNNGVSVAYVTTGSSQIYRVSDLQNSARYLQFGYTGDRLTSIQDFTTPTRRWTYGYNADNRLTGVSVSDGSTSQALASYTYYDDPSTSSDGPALAGLLKTVTDPDGNVTHYEYYANRRGFRVTDANGNSHSVSHNLFRDRTSFTDELGNTSYYDYDTKGNPTKEVNPDQTAETYAWYSNSLEESDTDAYGQTESYVYDGNGNLTQLTNRLNQVAAYTYTTNGYNEVSTITAPGQNGSNVVTTFNYDSSGNLIDRIDDSSGLSYDTRYTYGGTYGPRGLPDSMTTPNGVATTGDSSDYKTTYTYNAAGQILSQQSRVASGQYITQYYTYDSRGNLTSSTDGNGAYQGDPNHTTTYTYDLLNRKIGQTLPDPDGVSGPLPAPHATYVYDADGSLLSAIDDTVPSQAITTSVVYDGMRRVIKSMSADGTYTTSQYDAAGNLVAQTDAMGRVTSYVYDSRNRCIATIQPDGSVVRTEYDGGGRVVGTTDARGNTTTYKYDKLGRTIEMIAPDPDGSSGPLPSPVTLYGYDSRGNLQYVTNTYATSSTTTAVAGDTPAYTTDYQYDNLGRKKAEILPDPDGTGPLPRPVTLYTYDANGNLQTVVDARGASDDTRDAYGNVSSDPLNNDAAHTTTYVYDEVNRKVEDIVPDQDGNGTATTLYTWYYYDGNNNLRYVVDANGTIGTGGVRPQTFSSSANYTTEYDYDNLNRKTEEIQPDPDGTSNPLPRPVTLYTYNALGNLSEVTDPNNNVTQYVYDLRNRLTTTIDALGEATTDWYDAVGNVIFVADALGRVTGTQYDAMNRKIAVTEPKPDATNPGQPGPTATYRYDLNGSLLSTTDPLGNTTWYQYDALNRQVGVTDALGAYSGDPQHTTTTTYDQWGRVSAVTDQLGRTTDYVCDNLGRKIEEIDPDPTTGVVSQNDSQCPKTYYGYDADGNLKYVTDPLGSGKLDTAHTTYYFYDTLNRQVCTIDPLANKTAWNTDTNIPDLAPAYVAGDHSVRTTFDNLGDVKTTRDQLGRVTTYQYDYLGRKTQEIDPAAMSLVNGTMQSVQATTTYAYDADGNLLSTTDPDTHTSWTSYDALNRPIRSVSAMGSGPTDTHYATVTTYDALGNVLSVTDPDGNRTSYSYDRLNRRTQTTDPLGNTSTVQYDADGNVVQTTDRDSRVTEYVYDALNRPIEELWLDNNSLVYHFIQSTYDAAGQVVGVAEADSQNPSNGTCYHYAYDQDGRVTSSRMAPDDLSAPTLNSGQLNASSPTWNWNGSTDPYQLWSLGSNLAAGTVIHVTMHADSFTPTVALLWWNGTSYTGSCWTAAAGRHDVTVDFTVPANEAGTWVVLATAPTMVNGSFALETQLNPTVPVALTELDYTYYADGSVHTVTDKSDVHSLSSKGGTTTYVYDSLDRLTQITNQNASGASGVTNKDVVFTYNADSSPDTVTRYNGLTSGGTLVATTKYQTSTGGSGSGYDAMGRLTAMQQTFGWTSRNYSWQFDSASNITQMVSPDGTSNYALYSDDQLQSASLTNESYTYDQNGNRIEGQDQTGLDNQLLADGVYTYKYDKEGNLIQRTKNSDSSVTLYTWDPRDRLVDVKSETNTVAVTQEVQYSYDYSDRLIRRRVFTSGAWQAPAYTVYDGQNPYLQVTDSSHLSSPSSNVTAQISQRELYGQAVDQILATDDCLGTAGSVLWGLGDDEGTIRDVVNNSGTVVGHRKYDSFGNVTEYTAAGVLTTTGPLAGAFTFSYTGQSYDMAVGLFYDQARWYDSRTGRFMSEDPAAADPNLYRYCGNNPMTTTDPTGMCGQEYSGALGSSLYQGGSSLDLLPTLFGTSNSGSSLQYEPFVSSGTSIPSIASLASGGTSFSAISPGLYEETSTPSPSSLADYDWALESQGTSWLSGADVSTPSAPLPNPYRYVSATASTSPAPAGKTATLQGGKDITSALALGLDTFERQLRGMNDADFQAVKNQMDLNALNGWDIQELYDAATATDNPGEFQGFFFNIWAARCLGNSHRRRAGALGWRGELCNVRSFLPSSLRQDGRRNDCHW